VGPLEYCGNGVVILLPGGSVQCVVKIALSGTFLTDFDLGLLRIAACRQDPTVPLAIRERMVRGENRRALALDRPGKRKGAMSEARKDKADQMVKEILMRIPSLTEHSHDTDTRPTKRKRISAEKALIIEAKQLSEANKENESPCTFSFILPYSSINIHPRYTEWHLWKYISRIVY
jgi:hypothetical protein